MLESQEPCNPCTLQLSTFNFRLRLSTPSTSTARGIRGRGVFVRRGCPSAVSGWRRPTPGVPWCAGRRCPAGSNCCCDGRIRCRTAGVCGCACIPANCPRASAGRHRPVPSSWRAPCRISARSSLPAVGPCASRGSRLASPARERPRSRSRSRNMVASVPWNSIP